MPTRRSDSLIVNVLGVLVGLTLITTLLFWPTYFAPFESGKTISFFLLVQLALPFYLLSLLRSYKNGSRPPTTLLVLTLLVAFTALSALLGVDPFNSFLGSAGRSVGVIVLVHGLLFVLYLTHLFSIDERWKPRLTNVLIIVATIVATYALLEYNVLPAFVSTDGRSAGFLGNPIFLAAYLTIPLFLTLSRVTRARPQYLVASVLMGAAILASGTRGALIGLIVGSLFWTFVYAVRTRRGQKRVWLAMATLCLGVTMLLGAWSLLATESSALSRLSDFGDTNVQTRLLYWEMSVRTWTDAPILGLGPGNFYRAADQLFTAEHYTLTDTWPDKPHNAFLEWLVTTGIVGLSLFLLLIGRLLREGMRRHTPEGLLLTAGLIAYLTQSAFAFYTIGDLLPFLFLIALLTPTWAISHTTERSRTSIPMIVIGVLVSLIGITLLTIPYHRLVLAVGQGNRHLANDPLQAADAYARASSGIIIDDTLLSKKYLDAVHSWVTQKETPLPKALYDDALAAARVSVERHPVRATLWNDLARLTFFWASEGTQPVTQEGIDAALRAIELAPERVEARRTLGYSYAQNNELEKARIVADEILARIADQPNTLWLLAQIDYLEGQTALATKRGYDVFLAQPEAFEASQLTWIVGLLSDQQAFEKIIDLYLAWMNQHPNDPTFLPNLAATYATIGQTQDAIDAATRLKQLEPSSSQEVDAFIETLN